MKENIASTNNRIIVDASEFDEPRIVKLNLSNLTLENSNEDNFQLINTSTTDEITLEFIINGNNTITSMGNKYCFNFGSGNVNTIISGDGVLTATSQYGGPSTTLIESWKVNSFSIDGDVVLNLQNFLMQVRDKLEINKGTLNLNPSINKTSIETGGIVLRPGGKLKASNKDTTYFISITDSNQQNLEYGLEITGGEMELTGSRSKGIVINTTTDKQKNVLISGGTINLTGSNGIKIAGSGNCEFMLDGGNVNIHGESDGIKIENSGNSEFTIASGSLNLVMNNTGNAYGIYNNIGTRFKLTFRGGETEIITTSPAYANAFYNYKGNSSCYSFDSSYKHKNYEGNSQNECNETSNPNSITINRNRSKPYLLILPIYDITYDFSAGGAFSPDVTVPREYTRLDDPSPFPFTLPTPVRDGYEFSGWTGSNGDTPEKTVTIPAGTTGNLTYIANWPKKVTITAGANMTQSGGEATQTVSGEITAVVYTADDGWYFPDNYVQGVTYDPGDSGISVEQNSASQITVSGTPTADVTITLPAASEKQKEATPNAVFNASGTESGTLTGVKAGMQYSLDGGTTWINITGTSVDIPSGVTTANGILVITRGGATTLDSDQQTIEITKAEKPTGISPAADGELDGVTTAMEYRKSDETGWTAGTESGKITGLASGTYQVRYKANGTILASEPVEVTIKGTIAANVTGYDGVYDGDPHGITVNVTSPASGAVIKYGTSQDSCTLDKSPQIIAEGSLTVYYTVTADGYAPLTGSAEVKISKPETPRTNYEFFVIGGTFGTDYTYTGNELTFLKGGAYTVTMAPGVEKTNHKIKIQADSIYDDPDHEQKITLTLSDLKMERDAAMPVESSIRIAGDSSKRIEVVFDIQGTNEITNTNIQGGCIRPVHNGDVYDAVVTGNGTLTLNSGAVGDDGIWLANSFTLDSPKVTLNLNTVTIDSLNEITVNGGKLNINAANSALDALAGIYINDGELDVTSSKPCLITPAEIIITGGKLKAAAAGTDPCILITSQKEGAGLQILGGNAELITSSSAVSNDTGIVTIQYRDANKKKNVVIDTTGTVTLNGSGQRPLGIAFYNSSEGVDFSGDFTMKNGTLVIENCSKGLYRNPFTISTFTFAGGETEIIAGENALFDIVPASLIYDPAYIHKNYAGSSAADRQATEDGAVIPSGSNVSKAYLLITPAARIEYNLNGGTLPAGTSNPESYSHVDAFPLINPTREGYEFLGWTGSNGTIPQTSVSIPLEGITGNLSFTANWKEPTPAASFTASGADSGTLTDVTDGMEYSLDGGTTWTDITGTSAVIPSGITTEKEILVRRKGTETTTESDLQIIHVTKAETPTSVTAEDCTDPSNNDGSLSSVTAEMEYRKPGSNDWISGDGSKITGLGPGTYQVRVKADGSVLASDPQVLTIKAKSVVPQKSIITVSEFTAAYDGKDHGITVSASESASGAVTKYGTEEGSCSLDESPVIGNAADSPLTVYYKVTAEEYDTLHGSAVITLNKGGSCVKVPPKALDRIWDGTEKPLLTDDGSACGGKLLYALGSDDGKAPDADAFTEVIPSKADAGTWYACYKIAGDANHKDSVPVCLPVTITKVFTVTVTTDGNGTAKASLSKIISKGPDETQVSGPTGTEVFLYKEPNPGYQFRTWQVEPETGTLSGDTYIIGNADVTITAFFEATEPGPEPEPDRPSFFLLDEELPLTGITGPKASPRSGMVPSMRYKPVNMELLIPELNIVSPIVTVPKTDEGYPVLELGDNAGLLEGSALPGSGISVIAAHNTLNTEEYGPFALIHELSEGDVFFVRRSNGNLVRFTVYLNEKIGSADINALRQAASLYGNTLTLLTCEDELPEGGYASRRIVAAKLTEE